MQGNWIPEICYEEVEDGLSSHIPFIQIPENEAMPVMLFMFESRETGEIEPGPEGEDMPVVEMELHQYADMAVLKDKLSAVEYDKVRSVLGLEPLNAATQKGRDITARIRSKVEH